MSKQKCLESIALIVKISEKGTVSAELYYRPIRSKGGTVIDVMLAKALAEKARVAKPVTRAVVIFFII